MLRDLGQNMRVRIWTDSSAAMGVCARQGLGKLRHLDAHTLWIQQAVRSKRVELLKIAGEKNPGDLFTKHSLTRERLMNLTKLLGCRFLSGRAASAPQTRITPGTRVTMAEANGVDDSPEDTEPEMPHLKYGSRELERLFPPLTIHEDAMDEEDLRGQDDEALLSEGDRIAEDIMRDARTHGRRRLVRNNDNAS